jgi:hypothetical protein
MVVRQRAKTAVPILVGPLVIIGLLMIAAHGADQSNRTSVSLASFNTDGSVDLPAEYRQWWHIGTRYKPDGVSILDGLPLKVPELMNAYAEPGAMASFQKTRMWPDGTQIVKEMSAIEVGDGCNEKTRICAKSIGSGIFEANFMGLGMMVKDAKRFPDAPGNWAYFSFGHKPPPYAKASAVRPATQCESCHVALAADTDYVISRAHIGLSRKGGN